MEVRLIRYTPEPELTVAAAARVSTSGSTIAETFEDTSGRAASRLLKRLIAAGHLSPLEHASFTFSIEGISRVTSHQLVRHRIASYTQQSQRFVALKEPEYIIPGSLSISPELRARYIELVTAAFKLYSEMVARGIPAEDARYALPEATATRLVMTMNARELLHACSLRLCLRSQWEIRELFERIKEEVAKVAPTLGEQLVAKCYRLGYCDELESCGLFPTREERELKVE